MKPQTVVLLDNFYDPLAGVEEVEEATETDLWFLPGPIEEEQTTFRPGHGRKPTKMRFTMIG